MFATLLLLSFLTLRSWAYRVDSGLPPAVPFTDEDLDVIEESQLLKWLKRHPSKVGFYILDDELPAHFGGPHYSSAAQKRIKPKTPIYLGLIGRR